MHVVVTSVELYIPTKSFDIVFRAKPHTYLFFIYVHVYIMLKREAITQRQKEREGKSHSGPIAYSPSGKIP